MTSARVLVVEDERLIALNIRRMLQDRGYEVVGTAASAEAAVRTAKLLSPDIILMDIHLEGPSDGIEAARRIEADSAQPIVFLTAYAEDATIQRASQSFAYSYLVKPVQAAELHATLQIAIAKHALDYQIRNSDRSLRLALDACSLAVWDWNVDDNRVDSIVGLNRPFGLRPPISPTRNEFFQSVCAEDRLSFDEFLSHASSTTTPTTFVFRYRGDDATVHWIESFARAYRDPRSGAAHTLGTLRDITSQYESECRLRQAAALFENLDDAVAITTTNGEIKAVNPAFTRLTGTQRSTAYGLEINQYLTIPNVDCGHWQGETNCVCDDGERRPVWLTVTPVVNSGVVTEIAFSFSDLSPLRRAQAELDFLAHHDHLTGLPNRLLFNEQLETLTAKGEQFSLYYIDLDHFKLINDSRGHNTGDLVLQAVAGRLGHLCGESGFAARLGGDEFVIITRTGSVDFARTIVAAIAQPISLAGETLVITASIGSSEFPTDSKDREELLLAADTAMYSAKREGPNRHVPYCSALSVPHIERYDIEQGIRRAFASSELQILYQPIVSLFDGNITGAEALVRWRHPDRGVLNPDRFIPIVEAAGLIDQLGEAVLRMACRDWATWRDTGTLPPRLAVNVSARQMNRGNFPALLQSILEEFEIPPSKIEIEITESSIQSVQKSQRFISDLKTMGVYVSIDDFGSGYSHLAALRDLPVDRIKLDRGFLPRAPSNANDIALLNAIVAMARAMKLQLTAEGIETIAQLELVRRIGCDEAQGFWFSQPIPFSSLLSMVQERPFDFTTLSFSET